MSAGAGDSSIRDLQQPEESFQRASPPGNPLSLTLLAKHFRQQSWSLLVFNADSGMSTGNGREVLRKYIPRVGFWENLL